MKNLNNKKKVLMVCPYFYPRIGGVENYVLNISLGLKDSFGWEVVVVTSSTNRKYIEETIKGIKIYRLPVWFKLSNTPINLLWLFQLNKIIKSEKPDVINGHTPVPFISDLSAILAKNKNIPYILTYQNDLVKNSPLINILLKAYYLLLGNNTGKIAKYIIVSSDFYAKKSIYLKRFREKIKVIPPGVNIDFINSVKLGPDLKKRYHGKKVILFVGQLDKTHIHKGLEYLIEAMSIVKKSIKNVKLVAIGKGDMIDGYRKQTQNLNIEKDVEFNENVDDEKLIKYYKLSDVVVLPSTNDSEGFGMVLIEAGACKKPVIGSTIGGIPSVISHNKTGLLTEPRNSQILADAIIRVLTQPKLADKLGENGYKQVLEKFTWPKNVELTHKLFNSVRESL